ncbi:cellulose biosynthesis protein BcsD [Limnobacter parvus]|uniref:Cellulose synthase n=1 Tax=Limnobacter parvus TaxID=2939690 RepID=A0ABT1XKS1_9BURK|nr:hypothetical protein [Limnobacter parvus]MCR2747876.1 hypothetical protein [Limnobacter parvus]
MNPGLNTLITQLHPKGWTSLFVSLVDASVDLLEENEVQKLLFTTGLNLAKQNPLPEDLSLDELQAEMNLVFDRHGWGYSEIIQKGNEIYVRHLGCPFLVCMGPEKLELAGVLLGGMYYQWFTNLGMHEDTEVSVISEDDTGLLAEVSFI